MLSLSLARLNRRTFIKNIPKTRTQNHVPHNLLQNVPHIIVRNMCMSNVSNEEAQRSYYGNYIERYLFKRSVKTWLGAIEVPIILVTAVMRVNDDVDYYSCLTVTIIALYVTAKTY